MARIAKNKLVIQPTSDGRFLLVGYYHGQRFRLIDDDRAALERKKADVETFGTTQNTVLRPTFLTDEQLRDAEAAVRFLTGKNLTILQAITK